MLPRPACCCGLRLHCSTYVACRTLGSDPLLLCRTAAGISIGKVALYVAGGGFHPEVSLRFAAFHGGSIVRFQSCGVGRVGRNGRTLLPSLTSNRPLTLLPLPPSPAPSTRCPWCWTWGATAGSCARTSSTWCAELAIAGCLALCAALHDGALGRSSPAGLRTASHGQRSAAWLGHGWNRPDALRLQGSRCFACPRRRRAGHAAAAAGGGGGEGSPGRRRQSAAVALLLLLIPQLAPSFPPPSLSRHPSLASCSQYFEVIDEFCRAVKNLWPNALLQVGGWLGGCSAPLGLHGGWQAVSCPSLQPVPQPLF